MIITIDGPTGSGKSSAARGLAEKLDYYCLSSGSLYRALAYILLNHFSYTKMSLEKVVSDDLNTALDPQSFFYHLEKKSCGWVEYRGKDITSYLKSDEVSQGASVIATNGNVREKLTELQRSLAHGKNFVLEGRDSGSVVFGSADVKFYLTAELGQRAKRWQEVQKMRGDNISFDQAKEHIKERDHRDQEREISPLIIPSDAIIIDNSQLSLEETLTMMVKILK